MARMEAPRDGLDYVVRAGRNAQALWQELSRLQAKQRRLQKQVEKHRLFEDYLLSVLQKMPKDCRDEEESDAALVDTMVEHYSKLLAARQDVQCHLEIFSQMKEAACQSLESLVKGHRALVPSLKSRLYQLQKRLDRKQWQQLELTDPFQKDSGFDVYSDSHENLVLDYMQLTINSMARQCCAEADLPDNMDLLSKLDLIKEFILDKMETMRLVSLFLEPRGCWSGDSLRDRRPRQNPKTFRKYLKNPDMTPRTPFPSAQTSECSSNMG